MQLTTVKIEKPDDINFILGQSHFIKTVEDIHESMVQTVPGIKFGLAFCESSGEMLVRWTGTDDSMIELAKRNALALSAGHSFILFLGPGFFPVNVLNPIKMVPEVCRIFCATANPVEVVIAETDQGPRHSGGHRRRQEQRRRGRPRHYLAQGLAAQNRLQAVAQINLSETDHEHDHGGFPEHEIRTRLFAFFPLSALIIHPCFSAPSPQI